MVKVATSRWTKVGAIKHPTSNVAMLVSKHADTGALSYEFGIMEAGGFRGRRHWSRSNECAMLGELARIAVHLNAGSNLGIINVTPEMLDRLRVRMETTMENERQRREEVREAPPVVADEERQRPNKPKFGTNLGELLRKAVPDIDSSEG